MTALADYEKTCWEALARHGRATADGTPARIADPLLMDTLKKAAIRLATGQECAECARREADAKVQAERRDVLDDAWTRHYVAARRSKVTAT